MSLQSRLAAFIAAVGADIKALQARPVQKRVISGNVNSDGTIREGSGFTVVRTSAGRYTITFTVPFTSIPSITTTNNAGSARLIETGTPTLNSIQIIISQSDTPWAAVDNAFTFTATATDNQTVPAAVVNVPYSVRGIVNNDGTIAKGSGFTVTDIGPGEWSVAFNQPFTDTPAVVAMGRTGISGDKTVQMDTTEPTANGFRVSVRDPSSTGNVIDVGFHFIAMATDGQIVASPAPTFTPVILADTSAAPDDTEKISWRAANGALVAEVRAWTDAAGELAQTEVRALSSSTKKAEAQLYAGNGSTRARVRTTNNPALSTKKREVVLEMHDDGGSVILTKALMRSDGTSDLRERYATRVAPVQIGFGTGWSNYDTVAGWRKGLVWQTEDGIVGLSGMIKTNGSGTLIGNVTNHGVTPPDGQEIFWCPTSTGASIRIDITTAGAIIVQSASVVGWIALGGIIYPII